MEVVSQGANGERISAHVLELEWTIDKFDSLQLGVGGKVEGEVFSLGGYQWRFILYPDGCDYKHAGVSGLFLRLLSEGIEVRASYQTWLVKRLRSARPSELGNTAASSIDANGRPKTSAVESRELNDEERLAEDRKYMLPSVPREVTTAQRGGPRSFDSRKTSVAQPSWGFPSFVRKSNLHRNGYLDKADDSLVIRCTVVVHQTSVRLGTPQTNSTSTMQTSTALPTPSKFPLSEIQCPIQPTREYTCRPASRPSLARAVNKVSIVSRMMA